MPGLLQRAAGMVRLGSSAIRLRTADSARARSALVATMGRMHGLPQKVGQILSMSSRDSAEDFQVLENAAEPIEFAIVRKELERAWNRPIERVLSALSPNGLAASLGQVHRGTLTDGTDVAVKVRYPGIEQAVVNDLAFLGWLSLPMGGLARKGFDLEDYREQILNDLDTELDYQIEARQQHRFIEQTRSMGFVEIPTLRTEWCRENVLVSHWIDGETIDSVRATWTAPRRQALARQLVLLFATSLFEHGFVHADPHRGNYRFRLESDGPRVVLYDFGCVATFSESDRVALARLIQGTRLGSTEDPYPLFLALGFHEPMLSPIRHKLPALCRVMFDPFCTDAPYPLASWKRSERIDDILGDDRWNFRMSGPARLVFLMRALHGLVFYLETLGESVNWWRQIGPPVDRVLSTAAPIALPAHAGSHVSFATMAQHLRIRVEEFGSIKVQVTLPWTAVDELPAYIDDDVAMRIRDRGIDLARLVRSVRRARYIPQKLIDLDEPPRRFLVWLE